MSLRTLHPATAACGGSSRGLGPNGTCAGLRNTASSGHEIAHAEAMNVAGPTTAITRELVVSIAQELGVADEVDLDQLRAGMAVELEHGRRDPLTNVTNDDPMLTAKIALAHLREFPDYYVRLRTMEAEAEEAHIPARPF